MNSDKIRCINRKGKEKFYILDLGAERWRAGNFYKNRSLLSYEFYDGSMKHFLIDQNGYNVFSSLKYVSPYGSDLYLTMNEKNKIGYYDSKGNLAIDFIFDLNKKDMVDGDKPTYDTMDKWNDLFATYEFNEGYAPVYKNGKWGILKNPYLDN